MEMNDEGEFVETVGDRFLMLRLEQEVLMDKLEQACPGTYEDCLICVYGFSLYPVQLHCKLPLPDIIEIKYE